MLRSDVRCCAPLPWLGEGKLLVLSFVPYFDEGVVGWGVRGNVDDGWPVVRVGDGFVGVVAIIMVPVESQIVTWEDFDGIGCLNVA